MQKLFSNNKGTEVLPILLENKPLTGQNGLFASAAFDKNTNEIILKLVNSTEKAQTANIVLEGNKKLLSKAKLIVMKSENVNTVNSFEQPALLSPVEQELIIKGKKINKILDAYSFRLSELRS